MRSKRKSKIQSIPIDCSNLEMTLVGTMLTKEVSHAVHGQPEPTPIGCELDSIALADSRHSRAEPERTYQPAAQLHSNV
jgi:hypothetical protein